MGGSDSSKLLSQLQEYKPDITALQETREGYEIMYVLQW
jgi:mRNA deadenylase 3'-5' endonuclease subunit Ccr4